MQEINFDEAVESILAKDSRYTREAYTFVREALDFTQKLVGKGSRGAIRHVSGQELLDGVRQFALQQFGPMAMTVRSFSPYFSLKNFTVSWTPLPHTSPASSNSTPPS